MIFQALFLRKSLLSKQIEIMGYSQEFIEALGASDTLIQRGSSALSSLLNILKGSDTEARWRAVVVLGWIADTESIPYLITMLADPEWGVRHSALWALGMIHDASVIEPLLNTLHNPESEEQIRYVTAMGLVNQQNPQINNLLRADTQAGDEKISRPANAALINPHFRAG
jgi:HEAT repeat protein